MLYLLVKEKPSPQEKGEQCRWKQTKSAYQEKQATIWKKPSLLISFSA